MSHLTKANRAAKAVVAGTRAGRIAFSSGLPAHPLGFHIMLRLADGRLLAPTVGERRVLARALLAQGVRRGLVAFGLADTHLHVMLLASRTIAGAFARYVETSLHWRLGVGVPFEPARLLPLRDQHHAYKTFDYVHRQDVRHELGIDVLREGTTLPDLLGLRVLDATTRSRVRAHLPRITRESLLVHFPPGAFGFAPDASAPLDLLVEAACAAFAIEDLARRSADTARARHAAVHAAGQRASCRALADVFELSSRQINALRSRPAPPEAVSAIVQQALVRENLRRRQAHGSGDLALPAARLGGRTIAIDSARPAMAASAGSTTAT